MPTPDPEPDALIACARAIAQARGEKKTHAAVAPQFEGKACRPDADRLVQLALANGMVSILDRFVRDWAGQVPPALPERLHTIAAANHVRLLRMSSQLLRIVSLLREHGIVALPYKGPALAEMAYGDVTLRQCVDLDLLVAPRHVDRAQTLLLENGFVRVAPARAVPLSAMLRAENEQALARSDGEPLVELHWRLGPRSRAACLSTERLMSRAEDGTLLGQPLHVLRPGDHVLALALHGAHHLWQQLEWVLTFTLLVQRLSEDSVSSLLDEATRQGARRRLLIACAVSEAVLAVPQPQILAAALRQDLGAERLGEKAAARLFAGPWGGSTGGGLAGIAWQAAALDSPGARVCHFFERAFVPGAGEWDAVHLPSRLWGLYYLVRPLRLMGFFHGSRGDTVSAVQTPVE